MDVYSQLAKHPVFTIDRVEEIVGNSKTAYSQIDRLMKKGLVMKVRKNIYSAVNPMSGQLAATRFQIACAITKTAYISHHSAFEYYGLTNQVFYEIYVSSETRFNAFVFDNISYKFVASRIKQGVVEAKSTTGVRLTDMERTVIDSICDYNKIGGLEELLHCLGGVNFLVEERLIQYLKTYNTQGLYQKAGYLLQHFQNDIQLSNEFFDFCKSQIGSSRRYLMKESNRKNVYNSEWGLMIPEGLFTSTALGGDQVV